MHDRLWTSLTAATVCILLLATVAWFVRVNSEHDAQLRASCERGNVLRAYAATDNVIAMELDRALARAARDPVVVAAARRAADQRAELAGRLGPIDCQEATR